MIISMASRAALPLAAHGWPRQGLPSRITVSGPVAGRSRLYSAPSDPERQGSVWTYAAGVRLLVRTEVGLVAVVAVAVLVAYVGLAVFVSGEHWFVGFLVLVGGVWSLVGAPVVHDRLHRERGEVPHALWGRGDRRKPPWWPPGRI